MGCSSHFFSRNTLTVADLIDYLGNKYEVTGNYYGKYEENCGFLDFVVDGATRRMWVWVVPDYDDAVYPETPIPNVSISLSLTVTLGESIV